MAWLILLFVVAPVVELYVIVTVAGVIGWLPTLAFLVLSSIAGAWLTKVEGLGVLRRMRVTVDQGQLPADEAIDGLLISVGGLLMFVPGFISTFVGLLLMVPPVRSVLRPAGPVPHPSSGRAGPGPHGGLLGGLPDRLVRRSASGPTGFGAGSYGAPIDVDSDPGPSPARLAHPAPRAIDRPSWGPDGGPGP